MSRFGGGRSSADDLAYGDIPQRWDRDRFERFNARGPSGPAPRRFEEDYRYEERDRPGRRDVAVTDRIEERGPRGGRFEERDRYFEEDRYAAPQRPRRRTDKELFGDLDPREVADMALTPYRRKSISRQEPDFERAPARPGLLRRQSSLDTFDRRPRYGGDDHRIPPFTPVPLPIRRVRDEQFEDVRYRDYEPEDYREVEIQRERSVHRRRPSRPEPARSEVSRSEASRSEAPARSVKSVKTRKTKTVKEETIRESSSSESFSEDEKTESIRESIAETERKFKKGKTRMPKRLVRREAIMDLGYPFEEEENFFVLKIALEKDQIDEVIKTSETYKEGGMKKIYRFEEKIEETDHPPLLEAPPVEREEVVKTEWINPPTVLMTGARSERARSVRASSPSAKSSISRRMSPARTAHTSHRARSRRPSSPGTYVEERRTVVEEHRSPGPPPPPTSIPPPPSMYASRHGDPPEMFEERRTIIEERAPQSPPSHHHGTLIVQEREYRSDRDIQHEIRSLEAERRALRLEREAEDKREMALRLREHPDEEFSLVEYRGRPAREVVEFVEREKSPSRNVLRVEKDRKERRKAKVVAAAMATLT